MNIETLVLGPLETDCYLVSAEPGAPVVIIDPADTPDRILDVVGDRTVAGIILTHRHFDHIGALPEVAEATDAPVLAGDRDADALLDPEQNLTSSFTIPAAASRIDHRLHHGDVIFVSPSGELLVGAGDEWTSEEETESAPGTLRLDVLETPGHTAGSISLVAQDGDDFVCFSGDTLFANGFGRTDLPTGSEPEIIHSIKDILFALPDDTCVLPGHGLATTIRNEKRVFPL